MPTVPTVKFAKVTPYVICIGDDGDQSRYSVDMVDVEAGTDIDDFLTREVECFLNYDENTIRRAVLDPNNDESEVVTLTIDHDDDGRKGPFNGPWLVAKMAPAVRAVANADADFRQMTLPLQIAS